MCVRTGISWPWLGVWLLLTVLWSALVSFWFLMSWISLSIQKPPYVYPPDVEAQRLALQQSLIPEGLLAAAVPPLLVLLSGWAIASAYRRFRQPRD